jgi:NADP-dependent 3-hydroxy acid dehydrogenase YdfG
LKNDKVAIATDSSRAFEFQLSKQFAQGSPTVVQHSRRGASVGKSASLLKGKAYPERRNVTNADRRGEFMPHVAERQRCIDNLVNRSGYPFDSKIWDKRYYEIAEEYSEMLVDADFKGTLRLSEANITFMRKSGSNTSGRGWEER